MKIHSRKSILVFMVLGCVSCVSTPGPPASLNFISFDRKASGRYDLKFESDTDFFAPYWTEKGRSIVWRGITCALDDDDNFSIAHIFRRYMWGIIEPVIEKSGNKNGKLVYTSSLDFKETTDGGTTSRYLDKNEINRTLMNRAAIPCKVVAPIYFAKPYYSKTMYVPVDALLKEVNK